MIAARPVERGTTAGTDPVDPVSFRGAEARGGHVESYFLRANDPLRRRALWLKATVLHALDGRRLNESWCIFFDAEHDRVFAHRVSTPDTGGFAVASAGARLQLEAPSATWRLGDEGQARGSLEGPEGPARWDLSWRRAPGTLGDPLSIYPSRILLEGPFPKSKLLTPWPSLSFDGRLEVFGETVALDGWQGMLGHNWGREHAFEYAWGQCAFLGPSRQPEAWLEGFSGRVKIGPATTPRLSALVLQRGGETFRFDRIFDPWNQQARIAPRRWSLALESAHARAELEMDASDRPMVCLGYRNPDGRLAYCTNSKLAKVRLRVEPRRGPSFDLESAHGGALEILTREAPDGFRRVV
ncbi:MAG: hypothetical protein IT384_31340 [Deltaproteobacteria bacterium]|nr:hypothetical protein [Deltaproteobacteria bacterium]